MTSAGTGTGQDREKGPVIDVTGDTRISMMTTRGEGDEAVEIGWIGWIKERSSQDVEGIEVAAGMGTKSGTFTSILLNDQSSRSP